MFSARWEEDAGFDTWLAKVGGSFGMILAFSYDVTWPFALGPVPLYMNMNIGLSAGFSAGLNAEFAMAGGDFTSIQFAGFGDLTIELAFTLTFTLGIGIKGMISAYVSGTACLNLAIAVTDNVPPSVTPSFSAYVKVGVEVLFFNMSVVIMEYPRSSAAASGGNATLFDLFMSRAAAEEEPEVVEPVSQTPLRYPQLAPEATKELDNVNGGNRKVRVVNVKGYDIAFYIAVDEYNWKILYWENLTTGDKGMADEQEGDYLIYDFDVSCDDAHIYTVVLKARIWDDQLLPDADADCHGVMAGYSVNDDGSLQSEGDVWFYSWQGLPYRFVADPRIEWASLDDSKLRMISSFGEIETFGHRTSAVSIERRGYEDDAVVYHSPYSIRSGKASGNKFSSMRALVTDDHDFDPSGTERTGWIALSAPEKALGGGSDSIELFDRAMYQAPDDSRQSIVLATGDITDYRLLQIRGEDGQYTRTVFYTDTITGSAGGGGNDGPSAAEIFRLKGIYLEPKQETGDNAFSYTAHTTDYDVSLPSGKFELQNVGTTPVLYWLGTAPAENKDDPVVWRLNCVAYDPATDTMSDTFVVSEFTLPDTDWNGQTWPTIPGEIMLTEGGTGYLTTMPDTAGSSEPGQTVQTGTPPLSLYSFPVDLKPVLDMQSLTLADTLVTPGQMVDATMTLMNEGNLDIAGVDFELVQVLDDGSEGPVLETLHSDFLDPTQSNLTMADGTVVLSGEEAIYRQEDFIYSGKQHDWAVARDDTTYTVENGVETSEQAGEGETQYVRTDVMVPGAMAAYNASIRIPEEQEWSGDIMLRLRATRLVSYTHMQGVRASAALAGNGGFTMPEGARKLVYELDRSRGRMVLREDSLRGAGMEAGLYSEEITAPTLSVPVQVEHQDITVDYRLGTDYYGEPMLDIIIGNMVNNRESIRLTCAVYPDGSDTPYYVSLPYYEEFVSAGKTHTISMPLKDFADPAEYSRIRVVILGVGTEECNYTNNEFTINLRGISSGQFAIVQQPEDATVQEGETAEFTVVVEGGVTPYTYRWEVWMGKSAGWLPIEGAGGPTLTLKNVTRAMDGWKYRCLITDAAGKTLTTREALLTVIRVPSTGDSSNLPLYLGIAAVSLALLLITRRKRRAQ